MNTHTDRYREVRCKKARGTEILPVSSSVLHHTAEICERQRNTNISIIVASKHSQTGVTQGPFPLSAPHFLFLGLLTFCIL